MSNIKLIHGSCADQTADASDCYDFEEIDEDVESL